MGLQRRHSPALQEPALPGQPPAPEAAFEDVNPLCGDRDPHRVPDRRWSPDGPRGIVATAAPSAPPPPISLVELALESPWRSRLHPRRDLARAAGADIRPTRMKWSTLPLSVLQGALEGREVARYLDEQIGRFPICGASSTAALVYLDSAASSQKPRQVLEADAELLRADARHVHRSIHTWGEEATEVTRRRGMPSASFIGARFRRRSASRAAPPTALISWRRARL